MEELRLKIDRVQEILDLHHLDALLLQRVSSFAWATCGASSATNSAETYGSASLLITRKNRFVITSNTEKSRLAIEEGLVEQGWDFVPHFWYQESGLVKLIADKVVGSDRNIPGFVNLSQDIARLRSKMTLPEITRMKSLSTDCAYAMNETMQAIEIGMTEFEIASLLAAAVEKRGIRPVVNLVGTDERIFSYRHPLPTNKKLERFALVVLCGRRQGLVSNLSRMVHFGKLPEGLQEKERAVAEIDAAFISNTIPGKTLGDVITAAQNAYKKLGFADEWMILHQGGIAGYKPREFTAVPGSEELIQSGQFFTWNPTIDGVKSEDTIFLAPEGPQIVTKIDGWPLIDVQSPAGKTYQRPAILEK